VNDYSLPDCSASRNHGPPRRCAAFWAAAIFLSLLQVGRLQAAEGPKTTGDPASQAGFGGFRLPTPALLDALDVNHDGQLDAEEMAKAASRLMQLDKNKDGKLSEEELGLLFPRGPGPGGRSGPGGPGPGGFGSGGAGPGGGAMMRNTIELLERFDQDKDGMLNRQERAEARAFLKEQRASGKGGPRPGGFGGPGGPGGFGRGFGGETEGSPPQSGQLLSPEDVAWHPDAGLYDPHVLRTLFFEFEDKDWEESLEDFAGTDVRVPAKLIVDGKTYANVGLQFRGNTSLHGVPRGKRRSLNVAINYADKKQRLLGYRGFNLLNSSSDPSFLRVVLYDHIAGQYGPAPKANLVRVVINGESWGIYVNEERFNRDFARDWFAEENGVRWRAPVNFSGSSALVYLGESEATYRRLYQMKGAKQKQGWLDLIGLCKQLEQLPDDKLETELDRVLNIDRALWFLAVDNVLMDDDGYFSRGSDYCLYQDCAFGRFHLVSRDNNETFRFGGGFGGPGGFGGSGGAARDPLGMIDAKERPLIRRLLSNRNLRARYLAHVRTIVDEWLDWSVLGPVFEAYRAMIVEDVLADAHNPSTFAEFFDSDIAEESGGGPFGAPPGLKKFVEARRDYLLKHPELAKPRPAVHSVDGPEAAEAGKPVSITARVGQDVPVKSVLLYYAAGRGAPFQSIEMRADPARDRQDADPRLYGATIPAMSAGAELLYYVEARAEDAVGTATFFPRRTEQGALRCRVEEPADKSAPAAKAATVVLNEVMASNQRTLRSPQGRFDDWIELANVGKEEADLSGMRLTDDRRNPSKWTFPWGTKLAPGGYLLVWADNDADAPRGLHANFKLSKRGAAVLLIDAEARGGAILDAIQFGPQRADVSFGRVPDGGRKWQPLPPTPGRPNSNPSPR